MSMQDCGVKGGKRLVWLGQGRLCLLRLENLWSTSLNEGLIKARRGILALLGAHSSLLALTLVQFSIL